MVHEFYDARRAALDTVEPDPAHLALARLEGKLGDHLFLVTQNIDDLHERGGSQRVHHMHGELLSALAAVAAGGCRGPAPMGDYPPCPRCGVTELRPDVVWFGEIPYEMDRILDELRRADLFVSIGTSRYGLSRGRVRAVRPHARRADARAQPRGEHPCPDPVGGQRHLPDSWGHYRRGMPFLLRVELPDVPGSLGRVATAIGEAGGDIEAIEIVEHRPDGSAVDDVLLETAPGAMPDSIVSACNKLDGVRVIWISRYAAGGNLFLDLEAVEELTGHPQHALDRLVEVLPDTFRADWGARIRRNGDGGAEILHATSAAPESLPWQGISRAQRLESADENNILAAAPLSDDEVVVFGRRGGPDVLDSELARLGHLVALAASIARNA